MQSDYEVRPVVAAILRHPALYEGPRMVKSPVLYTAGLLRAHRPPRSTSTAWTWLDSMAGQQLFYPPNVGGWDDTRWLDTATWRGRWWIAQYALEPYALDPGKPNQPYDADKLLHPRSGSGATRPSPTGSMQALQTFARNALARRTHGRSGSSSSTRRWWRTRSAI